jgi:phytoene synthase
MPAPHDLPPARYFAWLYSPPAQRRLLEALFAIEREIAGSLRAGLDHHVAHTRLQWWRDECERCVNGHPVHPLTRELLAALHGTPGEALPQLAEITGLVDTAVWDLAGATFETRRELTAYCERWAAAMVEPLAAHAQQNTPASNAPPLSAPPGTSRWRALGASLRELELLIELARDARFGRLRIPLEELDRAGADPADLAKTPWSSPIAQLLRERHEALRTTVSNDLASALEPSGGEANSHDKNALRGLVVWVGLAWQTSWRAQRSLPGTSQPRRLDALSDAWRAWRVARQSMTDRLSFE